MPNGQPFQPLAMRVTDGSPADNPVTGATVTFVTTLERNPQGPTGGPPPGGDFHGQNLQRKDLQGEDLHGKDLQGQDGSPTGQDGSPIILGTSQTQLVTGQDGLASITHTVGNLGPCDAFITVTTANAIAQFELENVDPLIAQQQPPQNHARSQPIQSLVQSMVNSAAPLPVQPTAASDLFAVPQEGPSADPPPQACSGSDQDAACEPDSDSAVRDTTDQAATQQAATDPAATNQGAADRGTSEPVVTDQPNTKNAGPDETPNRF